jgi:hypothetical protein
MLQLVFVNNTVAFFERNLSYFVAHPMEFQRLVAQLKTKQERQLFLHTVYMYYYPDVLEELQKLKTERNQEEELFQPIKNSELAVNSIRHKFLKREDPIQQQLTQSQTIDTRKVVAAYKLIKTHMDEMVENSYDAFYNLIVQLNSSEALCLEAMLFN